LQFNSQSSSISQGSLGIGVQAAGFNTATSAALQQPNSIHQQANQQVVMSSGAKDAGILHSPINLS
jgi:CCR4-NOT transcription complex subunit 3